LNRFLCTAKQAKGGLVALLGSSNLVPGAMEHSDQLKNTDLMTLTRFILNEQHKYPEATGDLTILLNHIALGCKFVQSAVNKAGLAKLIGLAGEQNVQVRECNACQLPNLVHAGRLYAPDAMAPGLDNLTLLNVRPNAAQKF
jgi:hypothetical protein